MELNVLLVEDNAEDLKQIERLLPDLFKEKDLGVKIDSTSSFEKGFEAVKNPHIRYDLIVSDTYKGDHKDRNAAVLEMIKEYRKGKFGLIVVYSSGECPVELETSAFVNWADKGKPDDIERAVKEILYLGIPQIARSLHDELDKVSGSFLWDFLEKNWKNLKEESGIQKEQLERIIRKRAALVISDLMPGSNKYEAKPNRYGLEYYIYPSLEHDYFNLGDILRNNEDKNDFRIILTPHCYLIKNKNTPEPKADHVLTVKTVPAADVIGNAKLENAKNLEADKKNKKLSEWARSPLTSLGKPEGRYWYLPKFLEIPHLYCDFLKLESVEHGELRGDFSKIATLSPPYAEALQACFSSLYGSVGIPDIDPESIRDLLDN